ncbi:MAG TPA: recombinase family protein [Pirellulaceae bacterium]|nr:recombinase family protein [Pirellulaceae bacterium]
MLKNNFDPSKPYAYVSYARMSSDRQNPRSPEQQFTTIDESVHRLHYPWTHLQDYRDDGISGRYIQKREGLQNMLADIRRGRVKPDLILVDTLERLGRSDEIPEIRRRLAERHGVLVLTADSNFADPTSVSGRALGFVENMRSIEDNRLKAHNVLRGKRDTAKHKQWPGGNAPFGYQLESVLKDVNGRQEVDYSRLIPDPNKAWIIQWLFAKAEETGFGSSRLARFLNEHPDVPATLKPIHSSTVGFWLKQLIYTGTLIWEKVTTAVVDDRRVCERNAADDRLVVDNFCEPLVTCERWEAVQQLRCRRNAARPGADLAKVNSKLIKPLTRGLTLKYPLTGLVRCGMCGRAMTPASSKAYVTTGGEHRRYTGYVCPVVSSGSCANKTRVPEDWLRQTVINALLTQLQLLPTAADNAVSSREMLNTLTALVERELKRLVETRPSQTATLHAELEQLKRQYSGWSQSLGRPDLPDVVRRDIEQNWAESSERQDELQRLLAVEESLRQQQTLDVDQDQVLSGLQRLHETLAGENATMANFQLALHIDTIRCYPEGLVVLRTCKLGILPNVEELVARFPPSDIATANGASHSRRRGRLALDGEVADDDGQAEHFALAPDRFHGLPEEFFWEETFTIPEKQSWAQLHADEVYERRQILGMTFEKLAVAFGKSIPTVRKALNIAIRRRQA